MKQNVSKFDSAKARVDARAERYREQLAAIARDPAGEIPEFYAFLQEFRSVFGREKRLLWLREGQYEVGDERAHPKGVPVSRPCPFALERDLRRREHLGLGTGLRQSLSASVAPSRGKKKKPAKKAGPIMVYKE